MHLCRPLILLFFPSLLWAQQANIVKTRGEAQTEWNQRAENLDQAENRVIEQASINALENAFGRLITQGNTMYIQNISTGEKAETKTVFNSISNTSVKGEVIEIIDKKIIKIPYRVKVNGIQEERMDLKCEIYVKAREIREPLVRFTALTLSGPDKRFRTTAFEHGNDFCLYFKSPESGYITIYLDDNKTAFCILPYSSATAADEGGIKVAADKEYILFDDKQPSPDPVDGYRLFAETQQDVHKVWVVFSPIPLPKPILARASAKELSEVRQKEGYTLPRSLEHTEFQQWMVKQILPNEKVQFQRIDITITKKQ